MSMFRRRGAWSQITNISDRDTAISLLRAAGHGKALDRNVDQILYSKVKIDMYGNIVELSLGKHRPSSTLFRQQIPAADEEDADLFWDLPESVGNLRHLNKLVLYCCRSLPTALSELYELKTLGLRFCDGQTMLQRHETLDFSERTKWIHNILHNTDCCLSNLKVLEIHSGIWDARSIRWMKYLTATATATATSSRADGATSCEYGNKEEHSSERAQTFSQLETVRFLCLGKELRDAILDFLSPLKIGKTEKNTFYTSMMEGTKRIGRICKSPTSKLKHLTWTHSGMTDQCLEQLLWGVVLPHHPYLSSIDVSGNQIRSIQFLFERCANGIYPSNSIVGERRTNGSIDEQFHLQLRHDEVFYHPLRLLNFEHNPVLRQRISNSREIDAFEVLLRHCFPLLGSLTPSWESWDARIEYLLRINRGGRALVEGNAVPTTLSTMPKLRSNGSRDGDGKDQALIKEVNLSDRLRRKKIAVSVWPHVLHRAYKTSATGFLSHAQDATAIFYLIRNGAPLSEIFAAATT